MALRTTSEPMSPGPREAVGGPQGPSPAVIENPLSGERIRILRRDRRPPSEVLVWELVLGPGGKVPSSHRHPHQQECFSVLEGELELRVGRRRLHVGPGESVTVWPGQVHRFANRGPSATRVCVETDPALDMETLLRMAAALAQDQHRAGKRVPRPVDLALFMQEFRAEVSAPWLPAIVGAATRPVAYLARLLGRDLRYRRLRESCDRTASYPR